MAEAISVSLNDSSDVKDFVIKQGYGVKDLSDMGLKILPEQYIQPLEERLMTEVEPKESIPVIDMSKWDDAQVANSICDAAEKWGFFQVVNHGVSLQVLDDVKKATHDFFGLPADEKVKYYSKGNSPFSNVYYVPGFEPEFDKPAGWKDYLGLHYVSEDDASALWPPVCKDQILEFVKGCKPVINRLVQVLMKRLNVHEIDETKQNLLMGTIRANLNYYPICPNPELTVGLGRHSDFSTLTVLLQDDIGGLYIRANEGEDKWIHVLPINGALSINIGDALQIMSNDRYKSVEHRVAANGSKNRISVPIFVNPRPQDIIGPLPEALTNNVGEKPIYKQVLFSDYMKHFFSKGGDGKKTIDFVKITN